MTPSSKILDFYGLRARRRGSLQLLHSIRHQPQVLLRRAGNRAHSALPEECDEAQDRAHRQPMLRARHEGGGCDLPVSVSNRTGGCGVSPPVHASSAPLPDVPAGDDACCGSSTWPFKEMIREGAGSEWYRSVIANKNGCVVMVIKGSEIAQHCPTYTTREAAIGDTSASDRLLVPQLCRLVARFRCASGRRRTRSR